MTSDDDDKKRLREELISRYKKISSEHNSTFDRERSSVAKANSRAWSLYSSAKNYKDNKNYTEALTILNQIVTEGSGYYVSQAKLDINEINNLLTPDKFARIRSIMSSWDESEERKRTGCPWAKDSLRGKYSHAISRRMYDFSPYDDETRKELLRLINIICPHCLKSILFNQLSIECPFCNELFTLDKPNSSLFETNTLFDKNHIGINHNFKKILDAIYNCCHSCQGKIRYIECYHCNTAIDLFAPYNFSELERMRYE